MSSGPGVEKPKLQPEQYEHVSHISQNGAEEGEKNKVKRRVVEGRHVVGSKLRKEDDDNDNDDDNCMEKSSTKSGVTNSRSSPPRDLHHEPAFESLARPLAIPTGPKASLHATSHHHHPSSFSSSINIRALCTPHDRPLSIGEIECLATLQSRVDKAIAGTGPSLRILTNIPRSIKLTIQQKHGVFAAQDKLDIAVLQLKVRRGIVNGIANARTSARTSGSGSASTSASGGGSDGKKTAKINASQHGKVGSGQDSNDVTFLELPLRHPSDSLEAALTAKAVLMGVNALLAQLEAPRLQILFDAEDAESPGMDT